MVRRLPTLVAVALTGALVACGGPNPAAHFCDDYGKAVSKLYAAAGDYAAAPGEFASVVDVTMDELSRIRAGAPDEDLRRAFDSAYFALTVFSEDAALADFLARTDFNQDDVVKACLDYGIELTPSAG
ncbi:hypothetical protein [Actinophytocola oryzae]|uniref:Lipoprotein n=1 Tax=Actinophytocola oryzae TaxID=502181 RepID=A0A4R7VRQ5_9PSEU|nr:hypothetical protein [Actinophytocola oryzae]TDV52352.1 hypothetical protein CLV71_105484 [Actinophytocola oryzae]